MCHFVIRKKFVVLLIWALVLMVFPPTASGNGELTLFKSDFYDAESFGGPRSRCDGTFYADIDEDVPDLRREFNYYFCDGVYTLTLEGTAGTSLTLYDRFGFDSGGGYLTVSKKDERMIWLYDLEKFPPDRRFDSEADRHSGAFEVYYHAASQFKKNISSLRWGKFRSGGNTEGPENVR